MADEEKQPESEKAVIEAHGEVEDDQVVRATANARSHPAADAAREAMEDPAEHEPVPEDEHASNPGSTGLPGLDGDLGVSSERTTPHHQRSNDTQDVSPGSYDAPDVAGQDPDAPDSEDHTNKSWGGPLRTGGEPKPAPIEDEKLRRDNIDPRPTP